SLKTTIGAIRGLGKMSFCRLFACCMNIQLNAYVTSALFDRSGQAIFALGDGTVRFEGGQSVQAHGGAILCAAVHPSGEGLLTGGDDGRLFWSKSDGASARAEIKGRWID